MKRQEMTVTIIGADDPETVAFAQEQCNRFFAQLNSKRAAVVLREHGWSEDEIQKFTKIIYEAYGVQPGSTSEIA